MKYEVLYADTDEKVGKVVAACYRAFDRGEPVGFDTEFYNVDVGKQSCFARAKLHLCSIAVKRHPTTLAPRGYHVADAAVFTRAHLEALRGVLESDGTKVVHNLPVDAHTLKNEGIYLNGGVNTLAMARWAWPYRARGAGFTLDALGADFLGVGKTESFKELFQEEVVEYRSTFRNVRRCECGLDGCKKRSTTPGHSRIVERVETRHPRLTLQRVPLESVLPGHALWTRALNYAAQDAVLALGVYDLALREMQKEREVPWLSLSDAQILDSGVRTPPLHVPSRSSAPPPQLTIGA
jgi:hypothetical protein